MTRSSAGPTWPRPRWPWCRTPGSAGMAVSLIGVESRPLPLRPRRRRAGAVVGRHAVPAVVEESGACHQRRHGSRPVVMLANLSGSTGRRNRCAACSWSTAPDRAGDRQLRGTVRAVRGLALPRRRVRRVLGDVERRHGGARRRGLVRIGDRRGAQRRRWCSHATSTTGPVTTHACAGRGGTVADATGDDAALRRAELAELRGEPCATRSWGRWPPSSTPSIRWSASAVGSVHRIIAAADLRPELIAAVERGPRASTPAGDRHVVADRLDRRAGVRRRAGRPARRVARRHHRRRTHRPTISSAVTTSPRGRGGGDPGLVRRRTAGERLFDLLRQRLPDPARRAGGRSPRRDLELASLRCCADSATTRTGRASTSSTSERRPVEPPPPSTSDR